jgi:hypothetical protein
MSNPLDGVDLDRLASDAPWSDAPQGTTPEGEPSPAPADGPAPVPYDRFTEVNTQRTAAMGRIAELERQIQALTGVQQAQLTAPTAPEDPQVAAVRADLFKLVPWLQKLESVAAIADQLPQVVGTIPQMQTDQKTYWDGVATQTMDRVFAEGATLLGTTLTPRLQTMLHREFVEFVSSTPEYENRYNRQDQTLVKDFLATIDAELLAPMRRKSQVPVEQRRDRAARTPQGGNSSPAVATAAPPRSKDPDALMSEAFAGFRGLIDSHR